MMKKPNKKTVLIVSVLVILCLGIWTIWGNIALEVNEYEIVSDRIPEAFAGFRIAQVSDLHNKDFGEGYGQLLTLLSEINPDIIVVTGDLIDSRRTDLDVALEFAWQAGKIARVYYVSGNHEARVPEYEDLKTGLVKAGVVILENQKVELTRKGESITLMGIDDPSFQEDYLFGDSESLSGRQFMICRMSLMDIRFYYLTGRSCLISMWKPKWIWCLAAMPMAASSACLSLAAWWHRTRASFRNTMLASFLKAAQT